MTWKRSRKFLDSASRMRYLALACDFDATLATHGQVGPGPRRALEALRKSGRTLILVSGRIVEELLDLFPDAGLFGRIVAENGAVLYRPDTRETRLLAEPPPPGFVKTLVEGGVEPLQAGRVIVSTREPHEGTALAAIRDLGLEMELIFNKGAVMVLPSGVNKGTGLQAALLELGLSEHNVVGIGDAENDHAFLDRCEAAVAVANALPALQDRADFVTSRPEGAGVVELAERLLATDLEELEPRLRRHDLLLGTTARAEAVLFPAHGPCLLVSGTGGGTLTAGVLEGLAAVQRQFCVVDPAGDDRSFEGAFLLGGRGHPPGVEDLMEVLEDPRGSVVANLAGLPSGERPEFLEKFFPAFQGLRNTRGRPHWLVVQDAHQVFPASSWTPRRGAAPGSLGNLLLVTAHPDRLSPEFLSRVDLVVAAGDSPETTLETFARAAGAPAPPAASTPRKPEEFLAWWRRTPRPPLPFRGVGPSAVRRRAAPSLRTQGRP